MSQILILYSTTDGHTRSICERLQSLAEAAGHTVTLADIAENETIDPAAYDKVVIGASIRYGKHNPKVTAYIKRHRATLEQKPSALFSVNLVARKPGKDTPEGNPYFRRYLKRLQWKPRHLAVFAGRLDYPSYRSLDRWLIRMIMFVTGGPTDPKAVVEFTDWKKVEALGRLIAEM
jgi:menaquinone-dependent protoporphyrinogen oxidase